MWSGFFTGADDRLLSRPLVGGAEDGGGGEGGRKSGAGLEEGATIHA